MTYYSSAIQLQSPQSRAMRRNQNSVRHRIGGGLGPISHTVLIALMLCVLGLIYLTQITKTSAYGYEIDNLKTKKAQLQSEKRDLEVENARLQALERVRQSDVAKAMVEPTQKDYAN